MWVDQVEFTESAITGALNSDSIFVPGYREGQKVTFPAERVSDWVIAISGRGRGGFTFQVLKSRMSESELAEYEQHPPFSWFRE